ncbi:MAG: hypothetical protein ABW106_04295 [Steroidobacteraceae bacterium]
MNTARKLILLSATLPFFAAPAVSFADEAAAMNACVNAFVSTNLPKEHKVRATKLLSARSPIDAQSHSYRITLTAKGVESGKQIAKGTCIVGRNGTVIAFDGKPVSITLADATLTSR